ncbi:MAG: hypothetical protein ACR2JF_16815 [Iamia sp.]
MGRPRHLIAVLVAVGLVAGACTSDGGGDDGADPPADEEVSVVGFADPGWFQGRQDDYLDFATTELSPTSILNVLAHAERATRDPEFTWDSEAVTPEAFAEPLDKITSWEDTGDFDVLYLVNLLLGYRDQLPADTVAAIEEALLGFEYWYTEPTPEGVVDEKYYWSENHQIIFHTDEYLMGQTYPDEVFTNDGRTGAEHRDEARGRILAWLDEKAELGFSEWHSNVYYQKDVTPLLTLVEWADDPEVAERAAMVLDLVLFDIALHLHRGFLGVTQGRTYAKDKTKATDTNVFDLAKLLFDDTEVPYTSTSDPGAVLLARAQEYQLPEVLRRVSASNEPMVDRERMNVPLDPLAPVTDDPEAPYGRDFDDPANVDFWWERGAQATWQVVPLTLETVTANDLWGAPTFAPFAGAREAVEGDPAAAQGLVASLAPVLSFGLLSEANTTTYRSGEVMLSTVHDYQPGTYSQQVQSWQATLDEEAIVFTTNPKNEPFEGEDSWPDGDGYWTGTAVLPRSAQVGATSINLYSPLVQTEGGFGFNRLEYTHAWFPTERFDEVVRAGRWTFGRKGGGYVGLWSWREPEWRDHDPAEVFTDGMTEPFDLVAPGGSDNVWIAQVGEAGTDGSFEEFQAALSDAPVEVVVRPVRDDGLPGGFDVTFASPTEGPMALGQDGAFTVDGDEVPLRHDLRYDNPWAQVEFQSDRYEIADDDGGLVLDFAAGTRTAS